jgi:hypothetical protein
MTPLEEAAKRLRNAYVSGPAPPLRDVLEPTDAASAYRIQSLNTEFWRASGRRIVGRKIGLTAKAVQAQLAVDQPDYGVLFDDMAIVDRGPLPGAKVLQPKAEAEVALVLARDLSNPKATPEEVAAASDCAVAAIEIIDSRIADWKISFAETVADNGSAAFFVLGGDPAAATQTDRLFCVGLARVWAGWRQPLMIVTPDTVLRPPIFCAIVTKSTASTFGTESRAWVSMNPHGAAQPLAESFRRAPHRFDPARVYSSRSCSRRQAPTPHPRPLLGVLSPGSHPSLARQGGSRRAADRAAGARRHHPDSRSWGPASPLRPTCSVVQHRPVFPFARPSFVSSFWPSSGPRDSRIDRQP